MGQSCYSVQPKKLILEKLDIPSQQIDPISNKDISLKNYKKSQPVGNINGEVQQYNPPKGYKTIHLNISKYNDNNDGWNNFDTTDESWIILYHKTKPSAVINIIENGFKPGENQSYRNSNCRFGRGQVGVGVYFADNIKSCLEYGENLEVKNKKYHLIFMCRVKSDAIKSPEGRNDYYIIADTNSIRPIKLLIKKDGIKCN